MKFVDRLKVTALRQLPGTEANLAYKKRLRERELRGQGYSRSHAVHIVHEEFKKKDNT